MCKRKDVKISGDAIADEVFLNIMTKNYYLLAIYGSKCS
jgi:hypothetical protein